MGERGVVGIKSFADRRRKASGADCARAPVALSAGTFAGEVLASAGDGDAESLRILLSSMLDRRFVWHRAYAACHDRPLWIREAIRTTDPPSAAAQGNGNFKHANH